MAGGVAQGAGPEFKPYYHKKKKKKKVGKLNYNVFLSETLNFRLSLHIPITNGYLLPNTFTISLNLAYRG
jgi:hypothetical protein